MSEARYRSLRELPGVHALAAGTAMCAGCGGLEALHEVLDVLGTRTVVINAAGCMTLLASYPFTPFHGSWLYTSMASAPAGAQGVRDALDLLRSRGRIGADDDLTAVVLSGDGSAYGMGLSATSAAIERGLDFIYLCYDNEGYGNTGQQTSAATPHGARTPTSPGPAGHAGEKKDLFDVWVAHRPRYAATVIGAEPLVTKEKRAREDCRKRNPVRRTNCRIAARDHTPTAAGLAAPVALTSFLPYVLARGAIRLVSTAP